MPKQATRDPHAFIDIILKEKLTVINQTPSAFYALIPYLMKVSDRASCLRYVIFGGEKLNPGKLKEIKHLFARVRFVNMYGITETTVHVTYKEITENEIAEGFSNIGQPIPTLKVFLFDRNMQIVPQGVAGELCVGGHGVARGYLNRSELTMAKFIPNPLNPEEIIYRSGDLACMRENGDLEYFGRMDTQIQLRGFRIELGEIEAVLVGLHEIKECVVVADEVSNGDTRIIAYMIPAGNKIPIDEIKRIIRQTLPDYMIPSFFIEVDEFPLTDNGKLDLKKLPSPNVEGISSVNHSAPENATEEIMIEIWSELLGIEKNKLGREYSFFEMGGHSLTAIMLLGKIREQFKKQVTIQHIYENPQLNDLCRRMLQLEDVSEQAVTEAEAVITPNSIYPIKSSQLAYWLGTYLFKSEISNVCEVYSLDGLFDFDSFQIALNKVAECHDSLWYRFSSKRPSIRIAEPTKCAIEYIDWNEAADQKHRRLDDLIVEILHKPFDLSQVPLFKMAVIKIEAEKHILLGSFPHIICDIVSVNAFVHEVFDASMLSRVQAQTAYRLRKTLAQETIDHEIEYLKSAKVIGDKEFWQTKLEDLNLLKANDKYFLQRMKKNSTGRKLITSIKLEESTIEALQKLSDQSNTSIQIIFLAIIQATLHTLTRQNDISTSMVYDMSGMYPYPPAMQLNATMIPVVSKFTKDTSYIELIAGLKAFLVEALSHVRLPGLIIHCIPVASALKHSPWLSKGLKAVGRFYAWYYSKSKVNKEVLSSYVFYILGMIALGLKNYGRKKKDRFRQLSVVFNVLPSFYEPKRLWSNDRLSVTCIGDREVVMNPSVFVEGSKFQDARLLNFDLLRDSHDEACLYLWGGGINPCTFACMQEAFNNHLNSILEDPTSPITKAGPLFAPKLP